MKKIVVEFEKLNDLNCGLGQVCLHLGHELQLIAPHIYFYAPLSTFKYFTKHDKFIEVKKLHRKISFLSPRADLWHCIHQDSNYFPRNKSAKVILTIHDLNFLYEELSDIQKKNKLKVIQSKINRSAALTFVSHFTMSVVERHLETKGKIKRVIYNGLTIQNDKKLTRPRIPKLNNFLFSMGTVLAKKNFHVLIGFLHELPDYQIVISGWDDNSYARDMKKKIVDLGLEDRFIMTGTVSESEKNWLYQNCKAFIFPSLQEGFGLPVIEAMSFGKPVFLSKLTSLPEVGGKLAFYFDNFQASDMVKTFNQGMDIYLHDPKYSEKLKDHSSQFSWSKAADEYLSLYNKVLSV